MPNLLPVRLACCSTCPFREGSPYEHLREHLTKSALTLNSRICHSTGSDNAVNHETGKPPAICRGARDVQLEHLHRLGLISVPTDAAYAAACKALGITPPSSV